MKANRFSGTVLAAIAFLLLGSAPASAGEPGHAKTTYTLTISATGNGTTWPAAGAHTYPAGARVLVAAIAGFGDDFTGWSGDASGSADPLLVVMDGNETVSAAFAQGKSRISKLPNPPAIGVHRPSGKPGNLTVVDWAGFKGAISYTFDDARTSQAYDGNYAKLKATGVGMTFYVSPSQVNLDQAHLDFWKGVVADGQEIGNHTWSHCNVSADGTTLTNCAYGTPLAGATAIDEINRATTFIEQTMGVKGVFTMASPYGDANWSPFAQQAGSIIMRSVNAGYVLPNDLTDQFNLPDYFMGVDFGGLGDQESDFDTRIDTVRAAGGWGTFLVHRLTPAVVPQDPNDGCCGAPVDTVVASINYMKGLHDAWGDSVVNVGAYWIGQKLLSSATPSTRHGLTTWTWTLPENFPRHRYLRVKVDGGTLWQRGVPLLWDEHGYYEVSLDAGSLTLSP